MAILLPHSVFFQVPKTGGTWVRKALTDLLLHKGEIGQKHDAYCEVEDKDCTRNKFLFAFVRHPCSWYQSFWSWRMKTGWEMDQPLDRMCASDNFPQFVRSCLGRFPHGLVSMIYEKYLDREGTSLDFIGRFENIENDLVSVLQMAGEQFSEEQLRKIPLQNVGSQLPEWKERCQYSRTLFKETAEVEHRAMQRFGYFDESLDEHVMQKKFLVSMS